MAALDDPSSRTAALDLLVEQGNAAVLALTRALDDGASRVPAALALARLGVDDARLEELLLPIVDDRDSPWHAEAVSLLDR